MIATTDVFGVKHVAAQGKSIVAIAMVDIINAIVVEVLAKQVSPVVDAVAQAM